MQQPLKWVCFCSVCVVYHLISSWSFYLNYLNFHQYFLNPYYVPGSVLGAGEHCRTGETKGKGHVWKVCFRYRKQQGQTLWVYIIIIAHMYWALTFLHGTILNNIYTFPFIMTLWNIVSSFYKWELSHREFKKLAHGHWASNWRS